MEIMSKYINRAVISGRYYAPENVLILALVLDMYRTHTHTHTQVGEETSNLL
jgi:hypothetical protein